MNIYGKTDVGRRRAANQDNFVIRKYAADVILAVVCDGMGGANGGNIASALAAEAFISRIDAFEKDNFEFFGISSEQINEVLIEAVDAANEAVFVRASENKELEGMGTTLVGVLVTGEHAFAANVGDSRLYRASADSVEQISHDHSYVQYLVDLGKLTPEEAKTSRNRNLITRAVGTEKNVLTDLFEFDINHGDMLLLCSDGLTNYVEPSEILEAAAGLKKDGDIQKTAEYFVNTANERGGSDNITAVLLSV